MTNVREIILTRGKIAIVDEQDFESLNKHKWYASESTYTFYAQRTAGSRKNNSRKEECMHRVIMGAKGSEKIDHIDGNGLNNRRNNLRICTQAKNLANKRKKKGGTSQFKGVHWDAHGKKWQASAGLGGRTFYLGNYGTEIEAAMAYNEKAVELHGEFAKINIIVIGA